jgi:outer membrane immunogenic protein
MARNNLKALLALAPLWLALNGGGPAFAADLSTNAPFLKAPAGLPYSWTGFYIGANLGGGVGQGSGSISYGPALFGFNSQPVGVIGGGEAGYNVQFGNIVLGVETDIQGSAMRDNQNCVATCQPGMSALLNQKLDWFGTTRGRAGWATGPILTYITGGVAYGGTDVTLSAAGAAGGVGGVTTVDSSRTGWVWGTGVEAAISAYWTAKVEWLYVDLGNVSGGTTLTGFGGAVGVPVGFNTKFQEQIFRGGVNYRFGGSGAAASMPETAYGWSGFYIGGSFGYALGNDSATFGVPAVPSSESLYLSPSGILGGGLIGYNWQFGRWVAGIDADFQGGGGSERGASACATCGTLPGGVGFGGALIDQETPWFGTVRGRLGYTYGPALLYATGGYAYGHVKDTVAESVGGVVAGFPFTHSNSGWAAGGGIENPFDVFGWFGKNWTARTEYLYVDLGNATDTFSNGGFAQTLSSNVHSHIFRTSLVYKFGS